MTEAEWLASESTDAMLTLLRGNASQRKLRLFAVACCRGISDLITDARSQQALSVAERFAEHHATQSLRRKTYQLLRTYSDDFAPDEAAAATVHRHAFIAAQRAADRVSIAVGAAADFASSAPDRLPIIEQARVSERRRQGRLLHDIFGNPFRPVAFDAAWRTSDAMPLAQSIHDEKAFDRMPILADALQDAGCDCNDVLAHCRDEKAEHVRGCWVVDLVLGKK